MDDVAVFGIADSEPEILQIISRLRDAGYLDREISILGRSSMGSRDHLAAVSCDTGALMSHATGLAGSWSNAILVNGVGTLHATGLLLLALDGGTGHLPVEPGDISDVLSDLGCSVLDADHYEGEVRRGAFLVVILTTGETPDTPAVKILGENRARHVCQTRGLLYQ